MTCLWKICRGCGNQNHYEIVCRSKKPNKKLEFKTQKPRHNVQNLVDENSSSKDSDEDGYAFSVNSTGKERSQTMFNVIIHDTPMIIMADSGASVNVLDEKDYQTLSKRPEQQITKVKIHPYKSNKSLKVLGKFRKVLKFNAKCVEHKLYVVQGSGGSLLSWKTSQELGLLKAVRNVNDDSSPTTEKLIKEYDELFHGLGKLKGYQIKLHIDESVPPVAQLHRTVPFHVRQQLEEQLNIYLSSSLENIIGHLYLRLLKSMMGCVYFLRQLTTCLIPSSLVNQSKCIRTINHISLEESRKLCIMR